MGIVAMPANKGSTGGDRGLMQAERLFLIVHNTQWERTCDYAEAIIDNGLVDDWETVARFMRHDMLYECIGRGIGTMFDYILN